MSRPCQILSTSIGIFKPVSIFKKHRGIEIYQLEYVFARVCTDAYSYIFFHVDTLCPCIVGDKTRASSKSICLTVSSVLDISDWQKVPLWFHTF